MLGVLSPSTRKPVTDLISRLADYIRLKFPKWKEGLDSDLCPWLLWHWIQGLVACMQDPDTGEVRALVVVRLFDEPRGYETAYLHNPFGKICYVDLAISEEPAALAAAFDTIRLRHGAPIYIMYHRPNRSWGARIALWHLMEKRYHGLVPQTS